MMWRGHREDLVDRKPDGPDRPLFRGGGSLLASARRGDGHDDDDLARAIRLVSLIPRALHSAADRPRSRTPSSCRSGWC